MIGNLLKYMCAKNCHNRWKFWQSYCKNIKWWSFSCLTWCLITPSVSQLLDRLVTVVQYITINRTRLPSNLRPTNRECAHLVTRGHFRPRDKDGNHIIRSTIAENPMLEAKFTVLCVIEPELLPIEVLHRENMDFWSLFAGVTLTLTRRHSYTKLTRIPSSCTKWAKINFLRQGFRRLLSDMQTNRPYRRPRKNI